MKHELVDPLLLLHSAAVGAPKRAKPVTGPQPTHPMCAAMGRAYWAVEDVRVAWRRDGVTITATVTREAPKCDLATTLPIKSQPDADGWIPFECTRFSVCPVPNGVEFEARMRDGAVFKSRNGSGRGDISWQTLGGSSTGGDFVAYRILPAKPAALPGWRKGPDVPEAERVGLWFYCGSSLSLAERGNTLRFCSNLEYRPAPPGVLEGDAYSPALYGEEA
jgi:hypothetical protein